MQGQHFLMVYSCLKVYSIHFRKSFNNLNPATGFTFLFYMLARKNIKASRLGIGKWYLAMT